MESTRQSKVSRLIQKELGAFFQQESKTLFEGKMITPTVVRVTADLALARVYLSIFPQKKDEQYLETVKEMTGKIRGFLGNKIRHQVRLIPELQFYLDDSLDYVERIEDLLKK